MRLAATRFVAGLSFLLALVVLSATPASAQDPGVRAGVSIDPDQFYFGGHFETGPLVDRLHFKPNLEIGFGDDIILFAANMEFVYKFPLERGWSIYGGLGPALNIYTYDDDSRDTDTEPGLNILVGFEHSRGLMFEFKIGTIDSPDFKFGVGWTFR